MDWLKPQAVEEMKSAAKVGSDLPLGDGRALEVEGFDSTLDGSSIAARRYNFYLKDTVHPEKPRILLATGLRHDETTLPSLHAFCKRSHGIDIPQEQLGLILAEDAKRLNKPAGRLFSFFR